MRMKTCLFALLLGVSAAVLAGNERGDQGLVRFYSEASVAETMDRLEEVVKERGFTVFTRIAHSAGAASVGAELRPTQLLVFGNPEGGAMLMQKAQTIGIDLPLKALVYEDAEGRTVLAFNAPEFLLGRHGLGQNEKVVKRMGGLIEGLAKAVLERPQPPAQR